MRRYIAADYILLHNVVQICHIMLHNFTSGGKKVWLGWAQPFAIYLIIVQFSWQKCFGFPFHCLIRRLSQLRPLSVNWHPYEVDVSSARGNFSILHGHHAQYLWLILCSFHQPSRCVFLVASKELNQSSGTRMLQNSRNSVKNVRSLSCMTIVEFLGRNSLSSEKLGMLYKNNIFLGCTFPEGFNPLLPLVSYLSHILGNVLP